MFTASFEELGIQLETLQALRNEGIEIPSPFQFTLLSHLLSSKSLFIPYQRNFGLSTAISIACLELLNRNFPNPQILILSSEPEFSSALAERLLELAPHHHGLSLSFYNPDNSPSVLKDSNILFLHENYFHNPIRHSFQLTVVVNPEKFQHSKPHLPSLIHSIKSNQFLILSSDEDSLVSSPLHFPSFVTLEIPSPESKPTPPPNLETSWETLPQNKPQALLWALLSHGSPQAIAFCTNRNSAKKAANFLTSRNIPCSLLHSASSPEEITSAHRAFLRQSIRCLILTEAASLLLTNLNSNFIIHYEPPFDITSYFHRLTFLAQAPPNQFTASSFLTTPSEIENIRLLEKKLSRRFQWRRIPTIASISTTSLSTTLDAALSRLRSGKISLCLDAIQSITLNGIPPTELAAALLALHIEKQSSPSTPPSEETPPPSETQRSQPSNHDQSVQKTTPLRKSNTRKPWRERLTEKRATRASRQRIPPQQQPALPLEQDESPSQRTAPDTPSPPSQSSETTSYDSSLSNSHQDEPPPTSSLQSHENPAPISSTEAPFADSQILSHTEKSSTEPSFPPQPKPEESFEPPSNEDRVAEVLREENVPFPQKLSRSKSQAAIDHARWLRISVGREHGIREHDLQALVEVVCDLPHSAIGEIRIEDSFSLVEIRPAYSSQLSSQPKQITTDAGPILFTPTSPPRKKSLSSRSGSSRPSSRKSSKQ